MTRLVEFYYRLNTLLFASSCSLFHFRSNDKNHQPFLDCIIENAYVKKWPTIDVRTIKLSVVRLKDER